MMRLGSNAISFPFQWNIAHHLRELYSKVFLSASIIEFLLCNQICFDPFVVIHNVI